MNKLKKTFIFCFLFFNFLQANLEEHEELEIYRDAIGLSKSGKIEQALDLYKKLPESFSVALNMASCYFALNDYARALLFLRKAEKQGSFSQRISLFKPIKTTYKKLGLVKEGSSKTFFDKFKRTSSFVFFVIGSLTSIWIVSLLLFLWFFFLLALKIGANRFFSLFLLFIFALSSGVMVENGKRLRSKRRAVVVLPDTKIHSGPGEGFMIIGNAPLGQEILVRSGQTGQFVIASFGWTQGWLKVGNIAKI